MRYAQLKKIANVGAWLLAATLAGGAFIWGARLHQLADISTTSPPAEMVHASALLKLTPEELPVKVEALQAREGGDEQYRNLFGTVLKLVKSHYVDKITTETETKMAQGAVRAMLDSLNDPDSRFVDTKERKLLDDAQQGTFHGIGAILAVKKDAQGEVKMRRIMVVAPLPGSPAERAGLKPGDIITDISSKWIISHDPFEEPEFIQKRNSYINQTIKQYEFDQEIKKITARLKNGMSLADALEQLTTKSSGELVLRVRRPGSAESTEIKVKCRDTVVQPVSARVLRRGVGYLRISQFTRQTETLFAAQFAELQRKGVKAVVLDLRNNAGGLMSTAANIAGKLTGGGVVGIVQEKNRRYSIRRPKSEAPDISLAILINGGTASVAELVAGALKDNVSATLVGDTTFGDGMIQTPLVLKDGSAAVITTGRMLTPGGSDINKGLEPDVSVHDSGESDRQLEAAEKLLASRLAPKG